MAMTDAYVIGVNLILGGDLAAGIEALIPGLEKLDASVTHANASAKELAASLRGVGGSAAGIGRAADNMNRLAEAMANMNRNAASWRVGGEMPVFEVPRSAPEQGSGGGPSVRRPSETALPYVPNFIMPSGGELVPYTGPPQGWEPRGLVPHYQPNFTMPGDAGHDASFFGDDDRVPGIPLNPNGRRQPAAEKRRGGGGSHMAGAFDAVIPTLLTGELIKNIFGASFDVGAIESGLLTSGWTPEQVARARALAQTVQVSTPGATIGGGLEVVRDLSALFRNPDGSPDIEAALTALPSYARDALVLGHSGRDGIGELFKAAQAGDLKGAISPPGSEKIDPARFSEFLQNVVLADRLTGGRVTPGMILQNVRTGGVASAMMDDKAFFGANLALIEGLGSQAASALGGFNRQFGAGRMGKGVASELEGVFPQLAGHWHSVGMGQVFVDPGAMGDPIALAQNPFEFIKNTLMPGIDRLISGRISGFDAMPADQKLVLESQEGSRIASSVTGSKAIVEVMRLWPQMVRDAEGFQKLRGTDPYAIEAANNPELKAKGLSAAYNAFEVSLGEAGQGPAIASLNAMTGWLNNMAAWAKANPDGAKLALEGLAGGIALFGVTAVAGLAMAAMTNPVTGFIALAAGLLALYHALPDLLSWVSKAAHGLEKSLTAPYTDPNAPAFNPLPQLQSYHPSGSTPGPVIQHITYLHLDDREIARSVTRQQLRMMGGQVSGSLRPDPSLAPQYGAHLLET